MLLGHSTLLKRMVEGECDGSCRPNSIFRVGVCPADDWTVSGSSIRDATVVAKKRTPFGKVRIEFFRLAEHPKMESTALQRIGQ